MNLKYVLLALALALGCNKPEEPASGTDAGVTTSNGGKSDEFNNATRAEFGLEERPANPSCVAPDRPPNTTDVAISRTFSNISLQRPVWMQQSPGGDDEDWYVVEQAGRIVAFPNDPNTSSRRTVLDMTNIVLFDGELGMLGIAFHPDWPNTPKAYLSYTAVSQQRIVSVISSIESTDGGQTFDRDTEEYLLFALQPYGNHNGGQISFGPDGYLYIGFGDGGDAGDPLGHGQNTDTLLAAMLRIDVDNRDGETPYAIPPDNPFANGGGRAEIYAWGLRNPWRFSWDRETGDLWVGDVGQNAVEEIDIVQLGGNYGWRAKEASACFGENPCDEGPWIDPVLEYEQGENDKSITGGYVYRGEKIESLRGKYVFGDFVSGRMWVAVEDPNTGALKRELIRETNINMSSFAEGNDGELYFLDYFNGRVMALEEAAPAGPDNFPRKLSETGCFDSTDPTQVATGLIPYRVNAPFWSDGAVKERYVSIPDGTKIEVGSDDDWILPMGSVVVKNFYLDGKLFETRLMVHHDDSDWAGYSYEWRDDLSDADLVVGGKTKEIAGQQWVFPSSGDCLQCHTEAAGRTLGLEHAQMNRDQLYPSTELVANQVDTLEHIGWFDQSPGDASELAALPDPFGDAALQERVKSYLHTNCAQCHRSDGNLRVDFDLRYDTPASERQVCDADYVNTNLGVPGAKLVVPGAKERSLAHLRMTRRDANAMPPLGSTVIDEAGADLIGEWVDSLQGCP